MNIRTRLALGLAILLIVNLAVGFYAVYTYRLATTMESEIRELTSQIVSTSLSAQVHFKKQVQEWKNILLRGHDPELYRKYFSQFHDEEHNTRDAVENLISLLGDNPEAGQIAREFLAAHKRLGGQYLHALESFHQAEQNPHIAVDMQVRGIDRQPTDLLDRVVSSARTYKQQQLAEIENTVARVERRIILIVISVITGTIALMVWLIDRSIGRPVMTATRIAQRISNGNLSSPIEAHGKGEAAKMLLALRTMQDSLASYRKTLRESEERTRLILDSSGEGIYGVNTAGECIFCNPAGLSMLGYNRVSDVLHRDMHALTHHTYADGSPYSVDDCKASVTYHSGIPAHVDDEVFWRSDGTSFPVEYSSYPVRQEGRLIGAVVTFSDISERKRAEAELRMAHAELAEEKSMLEDRVRERTAELNHAIDELARTARAKDEFLASMSHELRTPLTSILGISEVFSDQMYGPLNEQQLKAVATVQESANHLLALINDILDVAKLEAGKMKPEFDAVPVEQLCDASLRIVRQTARQKHLEVSLQMDPEARIIFGDSRHLKQMLVNLLGNAVKFTPDGGSVGLDVTGNAERSQIVFSVWDTGIGIPEEQLGRLFQPFMQLDTRLSRQYSGTGLGLALVYRMASLHGGSVSVDSKPGEGSRFNVTLPWERDAQEQRVPGSTGELDTTEDLVTVSGTDVTVLLAEDNEANANMLSGYLSKVGYRVINARDGVETVAMAIEEHPDIVLMDIQMPNMDGLEATRRLRADSSFNRTPIIALTALAMPGDRERCLVAGADDYLSKPIGLKELHRLITGWLNRVVEE